MDEQDYWDTQEGEAEIKRQIAEWKIEARQMASEADLPEHKRSGYAERMYEQADIRRKEQRETF